MTQETFVELYLVKVGNVSINEAEMIVYNYCRRFPNKGIIGICGYIKYQQKHCFKSEDIFMNIMYELQNAGLGSVKTTTESFWVEMQNDRMPVL